MSTSLNPRAEQTHPSEAAREATGPVAADSLAADSLRESGGFAENENAHALGVKGGQSTLNTTGTQGATALHPAQSGAAREKQDARAAGADEKGHTGLKLDALGQADFDGQHSLRGYVGGPSRGGGAGPGENVKAGDSDFGASRGGATNAGQKDSNIRSTGSDFTGSGGSGVTSNTSSSSSSTANTTSSSAAAAGGPKAGTGVRPHVDAAPNYVGAVTGSVLSEGTFKPKGQNLEDADMTQSIPQTKTFTGDVGGVHDPGRLAERDFEGRNTDPNTELSKAGEDGGRQRDGPVASEGRGGQYDVLESERV